MRIVRTAIIAGVASAVLAGGAIAAHDESRMMLVALPDGSVEHIRYEGDVAPQIVLVRDPAPAEMFAAAFGADSPFAEMDHMSAMMEAHADAMMRQAAVLQAALPATTGKGVVMTNAAGQPVGVMHYSYVSNTTDENGCTQSVSYSSDGSSNQPRVVRTSAGSCGTAQSAPAVTPTSAATQQQPSPVTSTAALAPKPKAKVTPVSVPTAPPYFTPSRT